MPTTTARGSVQRILSAVTSTADKDPLHSPSVGMTVRIQSESVFGFSRNPQGTVWVEGSTIPIVPGAALFDLDRNGGTRPSPAYGYHAAEDVSGAPMREGSVGAGAGACCAGGNLSQRCPGGIGTWAMKFGTYTVGACAAVNAYGVVRDIDGGRWFPCPQEDLLSPERSKVGVDNNTTLVVVATDYPLSRSRLGVIARMAGAGIARAIYPAFTPFDGDIVFAASTGKDTNATVTPDLLSRLGHAAAECVYASILRGVGLRGRNP